MVPTYIRGGRKSKSVVGRYLAERGHRVLVLLEHGLLQGMWSVTAECMDRPIAPSPRSFPMCAPYPTPFPTQSSDTPIPTPMNTPGKGRAPPAYRATRPPDPTPSRPPCTPARRCDPCACSRVGGVGGWVLKMGVKGGGSMDHSAARKGRNAPCLQHHHTVDAVRGPQVPRSRQTRHARANDHHLRACAVCVCVCLCVCVCVSVCVCVCVCVRVWTKGGDHTWGWAGTPSCATARVLPIDGNAPSPLS
jgi:hypothetical protein